MGLADFAHFGMLSSAAKRVARWEPAAVERVQRRRLRRLLRHAVRAPFYRDRFRGLDLTACEPTALPPTAKAELDDHFDAAVTDPAVRRADVQAYLSDEANLGRYFRGRYAVSHTSGSQGRPLPLVQDKFALKVLFAVLAARASATRLSLVGAARRLFQPDRLAVVGTGRGFYPSAAAFEFLPKIAGRFVRFLRLSAIAPDLIDRLNAFRPTSLSSYPSGLEVLARDADRLTFLPGLRQVSSTGEQLTAAARARLTAAFGVPIFDHYGAGECLFVADACPTDGGVHVNADWVVLEVVDDDYRPVPPGETGSRVLVTNLANRVQPVIRYELGDRVAWADRPCRCGSRLPRLARIEGRAVDVLRLRDGAATRDVPGAVFTTAIDRVVGIREWQVEQNAPDRIVVRLEPLPGNRFEPAAAERALTDGLRAAGFPAAVGVSVLVVPALTADAGSGKFRRFVYTTPT